MEVDEHLAMMNDDRLELYRKALRQAGTTRDGNVFNRPSLAAVMTDVGDGQLNKKGRRSSSSTPTAHISHPVYEHLETRLENLVSEVRHLTAAHAAAETKQLVVNDEEVESVKYEADVLTKQLSIKLMELSNLMAYSVIVTRTVPENYTKQVERLSIDLMERRNDLLMQILGDTNAKNAKSVSNANRSKIEQSIDLFREADRVRSEDAGDAWPGKYQHLILRPPVFAQPPSLDKPTQRQPFSAAAKQPPKRQMSEQQAPEIANDIDTKKQRKTPKKEKKTSSQKQKKPALPLE